MSIIPLVHLTGPRHVGESVTVPAQECSAWDEVPPVALAEIARLRAEVERLRRRAQVHEH